MPDLAITPQAVDFGQLVPGDAAEAVVTVANLGDEDLTLTELSLVDPDGPFTLSAFGAELVAPGTETDFAVTWTVAGFGAVSGEVLVGSDDPDDPLVSVPLSGDTLLPDLVLTPEHHDFGALDLGDTDTVVLTVENVGGAAAVLSDWDFVSTSETELSLAEPLPGESVLEPGESLALTATYPPADEVADEATLLVSSDHPDQPQLSASLAGTGLAPPIVEYDVEVLLTADDQWLGWIDGTSITAPNQTSWSYTDTLTWTLESGTHVLAIHAEDTASVISGFNSVIWIDGVREYRTGDGVWKMTNTMPASDFIDATYDDSAWSPAIVCADQSTWGTYWPADFIAEGAQWVWWTSDCGDLKEAWFRLVIELP